MLEWRLEIYIIQILLAPEEVKDAMQRVQECGLLNRVISCFVRRTCTGIKQAQKPFDIAVQKKTAFFLFVEPAEPPHAWRMVPAERP